MHWCQLLVLLLFCSLQGTPAHSPYPEHFTVFKQPKRSAVYGQRSVVSSLESFRWSFHHITGGIFEGVDWNNIMVAGER
jgi:hypothetical protein